MSAYRSKYDPLEDPLEFRQTTIGQYRTKITANMHCTMRYLFWLYVNVLTNFLKDTVILCVISGAL